LGSTGGAFSLCSSIRGGGGFPFGQGRGGAFLKGGGGFPFGQGTGGGFLKGSSDDWPMLAITLSTILHINVHPMNVHMPA
jgi:hypothetical protein